MNYIIFIFLLLTLFSCGYPDIDSVPDFNKFNLSADEIEDFCNNSYLTKDDIENCINKYNNREKL